MPNANYPFDQDISFNTFIITDTTIVTALLGRPFNQSELVPVSYTRLIAQSIIDASITWFPVKEFTFFSIAAPDSKLSDETTFNDQGEVLKNALNELFNYWKTQLMTNSNSPWAIPLRAPLIVVTQKQPIIISPDPTSPDNSKIVLTFEIVTYVLPTSIYA